MYTYQQKQKFVVEFETLMEEKLRKTDRRTIYTRKLIKDNFVKLLDNGTPVEKMTVTELCRLSEINRCTFYLHYSDTFDVLDELQKEVQDTMKECVYASLADETKRQDICAVLFESIRESDVFRVLNRYDLTSPILKRVCEYSKSLLVKLCVETKQFKQREAELFSLFLISGCAAVSEYQVFTHWSTFKQDNKFVTKMLDHLYSMLDFHAIGQALRGKPAARKV